MMKARLSLVFALLLICTGAVVAQTPDGGTPSSETVCDAETGAAYGLCNAYCEAMDCDSDNPSASETACSKVRSKFQNITDRDLPCEAVACPCNDPAVSPIFAGIVAGTTSFNLCFLLNPGILLADGGITLGFSNLSTCGDEFDGVAIPVSPAEGQACFDLLSQAAAAREVICN